MSLEDKVTEACHRIEELYYETDGKCYISFSGGKDSTVILALTKMCEDILTIPKNAIPAVFVNTGIEMGVTVDFVKWVKENWYENVVTIRPEKSFDWVLKNKGKPVRSKVKSEFLHRYHKGVRSECTMQNLVRGVTNSGKIARRTRLADRDFHMLHDDFDIVASPECCRELKKLPFVRYAKENGIKGYALGTRADEGGVRAMNAMNHNGKICTSISKGYIKKAVIVDWSTEDVDEFVEKYNVPLSDAYTKYGFDRTGCMGCPFNKNIGRDLRYLHDFEPGRYKACMHWLKDVYIAQDVELPYDQEYEEERKEAWKEKYEPMRQEMLRKYRPDSRMIKDGDQMDIFDFLDRP